MDVTMKEKLRECCHEEILGYRINQYAFLIRDEPCSTNPHPWCHVYVLNGNVTCDRR